MDLRVLISSGVAAAVCLGGGFAAAGALPQDDAAVTYVESAIEPRAEGGVLIDGEHVVTGSGTKKDPYVVDWRLLTATARTYRPQMGTNELPSWVKMLEGKRVRIDGYAAMPFMAVESDEMLVMLNQWDGCCIGVPPSPYDAVEVKLTKPQSLGMAHGSPTATVTGVFKTDPFVVNGWLVGLYLLEEAEAEFKGF